jgi:CRISPR-associated protein Cmr2
MMNALNPFILRYRDGGENYMQYVAGISLGPVQRFIAAARQTRDLAFGSQMLGVLSKFAAQKAASLGADVIFPAVLDNASSNKVVVQIETNPVDVGRIFAEIEHATRQELVRQANDFVQRFAPQDFDTREAAVWQIQDVLEIYWAAVPVINNNYADAVDMMEQTLAARKNTRDFANNSAASGQYKSSLTGTYESVIPAARYPVQSDSAAVVRAKKLDLADKYGIDGSEQLSGIDLFKRIGTLDNQPFQFPSLATMAARGSVMVLDADDQQRLNHLWQQVYGRDFWSSDSVQQENLMEQIDDIRDQLRTRAYQACRRADIASISTAWPQIDAIITGVSSGASIEQSETLEYLFPFMRVLNSEAQSAMLDDFISKHRIQLPPISDSLVKRVHLHTLRMRKAVNPYYGLLLADGDHMGLFIHEFAKYGANAHRELSTAMIYFANDVHRIARKSGGEAIYAGGDDMLVLVPTPQLLICADQLQKSFVRFISTAMQKCGIAQSANLTPSLSMGAVIAHFRESLQEALYLARETEARAKRVRNALAIQTAKRSGGNVTVVGSWAHFVPHMQSIADLWHQKKLPHGYAYDIQQMIARIAPEKGDKYAVQLRQIVRLESQRILQQKRMSAIDSVTTVFDDVRFIEPPEVSVDSDPYLRQLHQWVNEILVARMLNGSEEA